MRSLLIVTLDPERGRRLMFWGILIVFERLAHVPGGGEYFLMNLRPGLLPRASVEKFQRYQIGGFDGRKESLSA